MWFASFSFSSSQVPGSNRCDTLTFKSVGSAPEKGPCGMNAFITIMLDIILPVFVLIGIGAALQRKFSLDLYTLAKINIYFLVPGIIFVKLYEAKLSWDVFQQVFIFFALFIVSLYVFSLLASLLFRYNKSMKVAFSNSVLFYNSGNYGVPVNDLVFRHDPFALSIQILILTFQNILTFSYGIFVLKAINGGKLKAALGYFKMPVLYAVLFGVGLNVTNIQLPAFIETPAQYSADAMIAIALLTLGAQMAQLRFSEHLFSVYASVFIRLVCGPVIAFSLVLLLHLDGVVAQALIISSAMPTSVNSSIIAQEYENEPAFATQAVIFSTLLSSVTVSATIYFVRILF
jgi:predicted permease